MSSGSFHSSVSVKIADSSSTIRPGRGLMTSVRVDRNTASSTLWVMNRMVLCVSRQMLSSSFCSRSRVRASSAPNGSSINTISGSLASTRAIWQRCCMPPDSS